MPKGIWSITPFLYKHSLSILLVICFVITIFIVAKSNMFKKKAKILKFNWWDNDNNETNALFDSLLKNHIYKFDEIHIYSVFGDSDLVVQRKPNVLTIQYSGEVRYNNPELFDINIIPGNHFNKNVITIPYMLTPLLFNNIDLNVLTRPRRLTNPKKKFCLFAVSNPSNEKRNNFFHSLSEYKRVDSCGKVLNNLGHRCPGETHMSPEFFEFIRDYKFMICFENSSLPNYLTEKVYNAYSNGTIPIYWGCPNIEEYVNMSSILYLKPDYSQADVYDLIRNIAILDNNEQLYKEKYESAFFKNGRIPDFLNIDILQNKIDNYIRKKD
jgi:hypothetical protein